MASQGSVSGLYFGWALGENGWNLQMDGNLQKTDSILGLGVLSVTTQTPPGSPLEGDRYIPAAGALGDWAGEAGRLVVFDGAAWFACDVGLGAIVTALDSGQDYIQTAAATWALKGSLLGQYADDTAAAVGGVAVDGQYVNSGTGAITVRLV